MRCHAQRSHTDAAKKTSRWRWRWNQYARYHSEADANELRDQLLNCPDTALQKIAYRALGDDVDTITLANLLTVIEFFGVVEEAAIVIWTRMGARKGPPTEIYQM